MPITETDSVYVHIQWVDSQHFKYIVYQRREVHPFDFRQVLIYHCAFISGNWTLTSVEHLHD